MNDALAVRRSARQDTLRPFEQVEWALRWAHRRIACRAGVIHLDALGRGGASFDGGAGHGHPVHDTPMAVVVVEGVVPRGPVVPERQ